MTTRTDPEPRGGTRAAVFLDRDGTVIHDRHYLADAAGVELIPGAAEAIARINRAGIPVILVTNQSGIGRGLFDEEAFLATQRRLVHLLREHGAHLDAVYHCPHAPDAQPPCDCRKPEPGLFLRAAREHGLDLSRSVFIGDRTRDVAPAARFGGSGVLVGNTEDGGDAPPYVRQFPDLATAVDALLSGDSKFTAPPAPGQ